MKASGKAVIGIDVGGGGKGFHAVVLRNGQFVPQHFTAATAVERWWKKGSLLETRSWPGRRDFGRGDGWRAQRAWNMRGG